MNDRILLIGQAPGPNTNPRKPLYPLPESSSGGRLAKFMGLTAEQYLVLFDRCNVLQEFPGKYDRDDRFPIRQALIAARAMLPFLKDRQVVFVGRNVANVFGYQELPFHKWTVDTEFDFLLSCVPHPSGRNRWYNLEENVDASQKFWRETLGTLALPNR